MASQNLTRGDPMVQNGLGVFWICGMRIQYRSNFEMKMWRMPVSISIGARVSKYGAFSYGLPLRNRRLRQVRIHRVQTSGVTRVLECEDDISTISMAMPHVRDGSI